MSMTSENPWSSQQQNTDHTQKEANRTRFRFTVEKDINLMKCALQCNPWQLGEEKWADISAELNSKYLYSTTTRTAKDRIALLIKQYSTQQVVSKTGTEEQQLERGRLIQEIISLVEESKTAIDVQIGAEQNIEDLEPPLSDDLFDQGVATINFNLESNIPVSQAFNSRRVEKRQADKERENTLAVLAKDMADEPNLVRRKRKVLSAEEEMIKEKQCHEMEMEKRKLSLEEESKARDFELENKKLEVEKIRLSVEEQREKRLEAENKRRDELHAAQLDFQNTILQVLLKKNP